MPDPHATLVAYTDAVARGDDKAIFALMTNHDRQTMRRQEVAQQLRDARRELTEQAVTLRARAFRPLETTAQVKLQNGEISTLELENGQFRVASADVLPAAARTPTQALTQLRTVLVRRSYAGLLRVLSRDTRHAVERDLTSLLAGLQAAESWQIVVEGNKAIVQVPGGHKVVLQQEGGEWRIDDFD